MNKLFFIAWIVLTIIFMGGGILVHGVLLHDDYTATGLMRPEAEQEAFMGWMIFAHVIMAGAFTWIYARGVEAKPWLGQGLRFGLALALFCTIPMYLIYYCVQPLEQALVVKQIAYDTILMLILGAVVAFIYRGQGRA